MTKEEMLNLLGLPEGADMAAVCEAVRALDNRALDAVAAQAVMGWERFHGDWNRGMSKGGPYFAYSEHTKKDVLFFELGDWSVGEPFHPTSSLDSAAALMPRIEEMGLTPTYNAFLITIATGDEVTPLEPNCFWALTDQDLRKVANATSRQRTEASVMAVAGRCFQ